MRVSYLEIYNESVRDLLGKDQTAQLEVMKLYPTGCIYSYREEKNLTGTILCK